LLRVSEVPIGNSPWGIHLYEWGLRMVSTYSGLPFISQVRFHTVAMLFGYFCPSYIEIQISKLLNLRILSVASYAFLDIPLTDVHCPRSNIFSTPVPDYIDTMPIVEVFVVQVYVIKLAPDIAMALRPA
jgi:hypothetical protein